jgi:tellurite resistance protein
MIARPDFLARCHVADLVPEIDLTEKQARVIARGMLAVARAHGGVDERELELIHALSDGDLDSAPELTVEEAAAELPEGEARRLFVKSCLLVALVDLSYSDEEKAVVGRYSSALGVSAEEVADLAQSVKEFLLSPLARLSNAEAVAEVSKRLDV